ncbi:Serine/threonine protein phosphatase 2A 57 kDa regulatory subunit B' beta isoform [Rhynchospora pubera]|uniref:Serine/threonine protein phosphatase 2A 57 kDa regulatory subunit B' beta isoform n=1 Tax=Rhynchospora pubera TaxID=906938 RepID=A0AAV8E9C2_9POAL|nr:Serine/threonine protein phosphatase 2A 57 kDa regulatory subunit B' beta isoform [Rhynchospora pubera]KAJ4776948.1 Serine/threonine protein phosphatase 2A 57 kDa regulatory subunit B' beta isoform [Rhynchospora pubera]KAJ4803944.1 Serine/threonine protein phosphatase 2A 57 kDa regulatory subunit B' beta isoform [Rhynchospora pubera]
MGAQKPYFTRRNSITLRDLFNQDQKYHNAIVGATKLPQPPSVDSEVDELLQIISKCNRLFTFADPAECTKDQEEKQQNLSQILTFISSSKQSLDSQLLNPLISLISTNIFQPLPVPTNQYLPFDPLEDDLPVMTLLPSWPHLEIIYDILSSLISNTSTKALKRNQLNQTFLSNLLLRFQSEDPRERVKLKTIYHMLYTKFTHERSFMRKTMNNVFLNFVVEPTNERYFGISELLEIYGSIINGFAVPLKEEHKVFFKRVLIPLHKPKGLVAYHRQLCYCVMEFVKKEIQLSEVVLEEVLRFWPLTNCQKEVLLIGELEELVEVLEPVPTQFEKMAVPLCSRITRCLTSCNSQVAERALYIWNNEKFIKLTSNVINEILPLVVAGMESNLNLHWSKSVQQVTTIVKTMLEGMYPDLYSKCIQQLRLQEVQLQKEETKRRLRWKQLEMAT